MTDKLQKSEPGHSSEVDPLDTPSTRWRISMHSPHWKPPTDIYETETNFTVRVEIAGMQEQDFFIELNGRELTIRGNRQDSAEKRAFHQMEIRFGEFALSLEIPAHISAEEVEAVYQNGFLIVFLPKKKPRTIPIGTDNPED